MVLVDLATTSSFGSATPVAVETSCCESSNIVVETNTRVEYKDGNGGNTECDGDGKYAGAMRYTDDNNGLDWRLYR